MSISQTQQLRQIENSNKPMRNSKNSNNYKLCFYWNSKNVNFFLNFKNKKFSI